MTRIVVAFAGLGVGVGLLLLWTAWTTPSPARPTVRRVDAGQLARVGAALGLGLVGLLLTGWWVAGSAAGVAGWVGMRSWQHRDTGGHGEHARIEALATWCEQLRDLLSADNGVLGTIDASVPACPPALRAEVARLSARLGRQDPGVAVRRFADEVNDPSADLVASVLLLAMSRSGRTAELLSELAATTRDRAGMRLRVEADRSGQRSEARLVLILGGAVIAGVVVFGRHTRFLDAYDSVTGQLVLAVVAGLYGAGMWWLSRLGRFERPARFLTVGEDGR